MPRQFTHVSRDEFESHLSSFAEWEEVTEELSNTDERVYAISLPSEHHDLLVFSTITGESSRGHGEDAIRTVIWDWRINEPVSGRSKTLRIGPTDSNPEGWKANHRPKVEDLMAHWRIYLVECPECGAPMRYRDGEYGSFFGCSRYPDCEATMEAEAVA